MHPELMSLAKLGLIAIACVIAFATVDRLFEAVDGRREATLRERRRGRVRSLRVVCQVFDPHKPGPAILTLDTDQFGACHALYDLVEGYVLPHNAHA